MTLILSGTDSSVSAPAVQGGTGGTTTGLYYPATNQIALAANGAQALLANSAQGVQIANTLGVGATTPSTSGAGISFPATQSASSDANTLDDYEKGTWTPVITAASGSGYTVTVYSAAYTKIGRLVTVNFNIQVTVSGTASGTMLIAGLPFAAVLPNAIIYETQQAIFYGATANSSTAMAISGLGGGGASWVYARQYLTTFTYQV